MNEGSARLAMTGLGPRKPRTFIEGHRGSGVDRQTNGWTDHSGVFMHERHVQAVFLEHRTHCSERLLQLWWTQPAQSDSNRIRQRRCDGAPPCGKKRLHLEQSSVSQILRLGAACYISPRVCKSSSIRGESA
eukprot:scaffold174432_cov30-Tisochrysis_lutea.AAC.1